MKWTRFCKYPQPYNVQLVNELYANQVDITSKRVKVKVRGVKESYYKATINMVFDLGNVYDTYQNLLETSDDQDYNIYLESLCNLGTKWIEPSGEKTERKMDLYPESKTWYLFIKHSIHHTSHKETINNTRMMLLHCITLFNEVNVAMIIMQEIQAYHKKKEEMVYFPCKRHGVPQNTTNEVSHSQAAFGKAAIQTLMKPKGRKRKLEARQGSTEDNTEKPKKRDMKDKKPKKMKTYEVPVVDSPKKNSNINEPTEEENSSEYEKTLNELMKQAAKGKVELLAEASVRMQNTESENIGEE
ncbi:hypothetical protein RYX36_015794 [Vicia faba]